IDYCLEAAQHLAEVTDKAFKSGRFDRLFLNEYADKMEAGFFKDLKHQNWASDIIIKSMKYHSSLPTKLLSIAAFGGEYNRFNKLRTLFYPALGMPQKMKSAGEITFTHGTRD
ncbi:MAG TPA: hypothetical protein PLG66_03625, partial [Calditrichia bacterium]|nr:hypothetical protein [Calditrichia bacterium]